MYYSIIECRHWTEEFAGACERKPQRKKQINGRLICILAELFFRGRKDRIIRY